MAARIGKALVVDTPQLAERRGGCGVDAHGEKAGEVLLCIAVVVALHGHRERAGRGAAGRIGEVGEGVRVVFRRAVAVATAAHGGREAGQQPHIGEVAHVEQLHSELAVEVLLIAGAAHGQQVIAANGFQIAGEAGDLQLGLELRCRGVAEVEGEQRVDIAEGDEVAARPDKTAAL